MYVLVVVALLLIAVGWFAWSWISNNRRAKAEEEAREMGYYEDDDEDE